MHVLLVVESAATGVGRHVLDLARGLVQKGLHVSLIYSPSRAAPSFVNELTQCRFDIVHTMALQITPGRGLLATLARLRRFVIENGPFDVIHAHSSKAGGIVRLTPLKGVAKIYTPHAFRTMDPELPAIPKFFFRATEYALGNLATDKLITVSHFEKRHALSMGIGENRVAVIHNGLHPPQAARKSALRSGLGLEDTDFVVGTVGRLVHQKAPERIVAAIAALSDRFHHLKLVLIGDGPQQDAVSRQISELGISGRCQIITSARADRLMKAFDLLALPSRYEGMPYVLLEAMQNGVPVVATDVGGVSEIIDNGKDGIIIDNQDDPQALANAIASFIASPEFLEAASNQAVLQSGRFTFENMVDQTLQAYASVCHK